MNFYQRFILLFGVFLAFNLTAFCQDDGDEEEEVDPSEQIAEQLRKQFDEVDYFSNTFFGKKNGIWEFVDVDGKVLTNMHIEDVSCDYSYADVTIKGVDYRVNSAFEDGKVLVGRYDYYAYMDKNGGITTPFIYDSEGEERSDVNATEAAAMINICDQIMKVHGEVEAGKYTAVKQLEKSISVEQSEKLSTEVSDSLLVLLCKTFENSPKSIDMKLAEDLFMGTIVPCGKEGCEAVLDYYVKNGLDKNKRFEYVKTLADDYTQYKACSILGDFYVEGVLCPKDIQKAIGYYQKVVEDGSSDYTENCHQKLADLWKQYGTQYDNQIGKLCAEYETIEFNDDIIILTDGAQKAVIDTDYNEILPKGNYDIYSRYENYFVVGDDMMGKQLVTKGGKPVMNEKFDDMTILNDGNDCLVLTQRDERWGFFDKEGSPVTGMIFDDYTPGWWFSNPSLVLNGESYNIYSLFHDGMMVMKKDEKYGCINTKGKEIIPFIYDDMTVASEGKYIVKVDEKYGVVDKNGNELVPCKYDSIEYDEDEGKYNLTITESVVL